MGEIRISHKRLTDTLKQILIDCGFEERRAELSATLFSKANLDGVSSHGVNRFPGYLKFIRENFIDIEARPECISSLGAFEKWDGHLGPGNLNAYECMERAIEIAKNQGMGCVALRNTNHWMRGGNFGWQAVDHNCIGICFTNTKPNMPAWGGNEPKLGNNPIVIGIPRSEGPVVLDMALAQFSYGTLNNYIKRNEELPYGGGINDEGVIIKDPKEISKNELALPIGLWKGAGLSLVLDIIGSVLSEGNATYEIGQKQKEHGVSQVFLCFYLSKITSPNIEEKIDRILEDLKSSSTFGNLEVRYPGERTLAVRRKNLKLGVPVDEDIWNQILELI